MSDLQQSDKKCRGFLPGADPGRCVWCGVKVEEHESSVLPSSAATGETPRTDAIALRSMSKIANAEMICDLAAIARQLERELADVTADYLRVHKEKCDLLFPGTSPSATEQSGDAEELKRLRAMFAAATEIQGDEEVMKYVTSGNAIPVTRCTVSADLIRQLVAARTEVEPNLDAPERPIRDLAAEPIGNSGMEPCDSEFCHVAEARGAHYRCQGPCAYGFDGPSNTDKDQ